MITGGFNTLAFVVLPPLIISITACIIAILTIKGNRLIAAQSKTIDYLIESGANQRFTNAILLISKIDSNTDIDIRKFSKLSNDEKHNERCFMIRELLNELEYVSIAIGKGIFDENMLKNARYTTITSVYTHIEPLIKKLQKNQKNCYENYVALYKRWNKQTE